MYQLYVQTKQGSWKSIGKNEKIEKLQAKVEKLDKKDLFAYMIIDHSPNGDTPVECEEFYKECKVEYSDDVKTKFNVKATTFKPGRMKEKEELRKLTEKYVER